VRIIAGTLKGRRLKGPASDAVRPTSDRLRETIFNILQARPAGAQVLDAFAGTGAIGLEALSRGAAHVTFVEKEGRALRTLAENVAACGAGNAVTMVRDDFLGFASRHPPRAVFDLVLLDPPYDFCDLDRVLAGAAAVLAPGGLIVLEHSRRREPPPAPSGLAARRTVAAGDSALTFYDYA
jgi:16S rRNA (guanine(966)-N(2))-methyltransferase RsmD